MIYNWDNLTTEQYSRLLQNGDSKKPEDLLWALTGKSKNDMTLSEITTLRVGSIKPQDRKAVAQIFVGKDGRLYGLQDLNEMPFGLFDDVVSLASEPAKHLTLLVSYLYRPVLKMSFWSTVKLNIVGKFGARVNHPWFQKKVVKWMNTLNFEIEKYDPLKCESRLDIIKDSPAYIGHHVVTFFLILSRELQTSSLTSLKTHLKKMKRSLTEITSDHQKQG